MRKYLLPLVVLCTLAIILTGCRPPSLGGPSSSGSSSGGSTLFSGKLPHACDAITQDVVEKVLGPGAIMKREGDTCTMRAADAQFLQYGIIAVQIGPVTNGWDGAKHAFLTMDKNAKQLSGLGDDAYMTMNSIFIRKGGAEVKVIGSGYLVKDHNQENLRYVADKVLAKL